MLKIVAQSPNNYLQEVFLYNLYRVFGGKIEVVKEFESKKDQLYIVTNRDELGYKTKNIVNGNPNVDITNIPKLSTIGIYKKAKKNSQPFCKNFYISDYPLAGRQYIIDELYNLSLDRLRVVGKYSINMPNYIGSANPSTVMAAAQSCDNCIDFDGDLYYELYLCDCNILQLGKTKKAISKDYILNELNYVKYFMEEVKPFDSDLYNRCDEFLNEEIRDLC